MKPVNFILIFVFSIIGFYNLQGQTDYPLDISYYNFIRYESNKIIFPADSLAFERMFSKLDTIILNGTGKISIVHIGGSHVQADIYPGRLRKRLQNFYPGLNGGRGMVFPYVISNTNSPATYISIASGNWTSCRNVELNKSCNLGLTGINAITTDSFASVEMQLRSDSLSQYYFDKILVFHSMDSSSFIPALELVNVVKSEVIEESGYTIFYLDKEYKNFKIKVKKTSPKQTGFELYGISLENEDPGIIYHSIGINGASLSSFLRCSLFKKHLEALKPDLIIISLGTNDAYTTKFSTDFYKSNYESMIKLIKTAAPEAAILNTVANDSYLFRRYPNKNTQMAAQVIYEVAGKYNCGVWDLYQIMGGFNSSAIWRKQQLMVKDMIHFNEQGYLLIGDLFFNAIIQSYNNHLVNSSYN